MPKYTLYWNATVENAYYAQVEAADEKEAWEQVWSGGADYDLYDWDTIDIHNEITEEGWNA